MMMAVVLVVNQNDKDASRNIVRHPNVIKVHSLECVKENVYCIHFKEKKVIVLRIIYKTFKHTHACACER